MLLKKQLKGLYLLTDSVLTPANTIFDQVKRALENGVSIVQYRDKFLADGEAEEICLRLKELCHAYNALFIVNDRIHLAKKIDADGVHIGKEDAAFEEARAVLGRDKIIGVTCYGDLQRALKYEALGADYVAFGAFFSSSTKPNAPLISHALLKEAKEILKLPICAIGGINAQNIALLAQYNIEMFALVGAVYDKNKIEENLEDLRRACGFREI